MGIYRRSILPRLIDWAMRSQDLAGYRQRLASDARGLVLEVGIGSGLSLPLYGPAVERVIGIDPSAELLARGSILAREASQPVQLIQAAAEAIPLRDESFDTIVMAWTLCSMADPRAGLREMRRVLRPGGHLLFVEHGLSPEPKVAVWQHRLDPIWTRISCHLDHPVDRFLRGAGFEIEHLQAGYVGRGPKVVTFMYEGRAH